MQLHYSFNIYISYDLFLFTIILCCHIKGNSRNNLKNKQLTEINCLVKFFQLHYNSSIICYVWHKYLEPDKRNSKCNNKN